MGTLPALEYGTIALGIMGILSLIGVVAAGIILLRGIKRLWNRYRSTN